MAPAPRQRYSRIPVGYIERLPIAIAKASPSPLVLLLWLLVSPFRRSLPGVVRGGELAFADALRWSPTAVRRCLAVLESEGAVLVDRGAVRGVYVDGAIPHDGPRNVQTLTAFARDLSEFPPESPIVRRVIADVYEAILSLEKGAELAQEWARLIGHLETHQAASGRGNSGDSWCDSHGNSSDDSHGNSRGTPIPLPLPPPVPPPPPPPPPTEGPSAADLAPYLDAAERLGEPFGLAAAAARLSPENLSRLTAIPIQEWGDVLHGLATSFFAGERAKCPPTLLDLIRKPALRAALREGQYEEAGRALRCACCGTVHPLVHECPPLCRGCNQPHDPSLYCRKLAFLEQCEQQQPASTEPAR